MADDYETRSFWGIPHNATISPICCSRSFIEWIGFIDDKRRAEEEALIDRIIKNFTRCEPGIIIPCSIQERIVNHDFSCRESYTENLNCISKLMNKIFNG